MLAVSDIIGKNRRNVERILGRAEKLSTLTAIEHLTAISACYQAGRITIVYVDNTADWITIDGREDQIIEEFFRFLGVTTTLANFKYQGIVRYFNLAGLAEIAIYGNYEGYIDHVCIKAFTK